MARGVSRSNLQGLQTLFTVGTTAGRTDEQLLERFSRSRMEVARADQAAEAAFDALVERHGPMVWGVCLRTLGDAHEAEDAFQATFLILARRASAVRGETLGRWLYGVARKVAMRARRAAGRRRSVDTPRDARPQADPARDAELADLRAAVEEEVGRLRAEVREAIELCHIQGVTQAEAARRLDCSPRAVKSRLAAGRERLRGRLMRRGLAPAAVAAAWTVAREARGDAVPGSLVRATVCAAMCSAKGGAGAFPASVIALATGATRAMFLKKLALAAVLGMAATGAVVHAYNEEPKRPPAEAGTTPAGTPAPAQDADPTKYAPQGPGQPLRWAPVDRRSTNEGFYREIQELAAKVLRLSSEQDSLEARRAALELAGLARGWEESMRTEGDTGKHTGPERVAPPDAKGGAAFPGSLPFVGRLLQVPPGADVPSRSPGGPPAAGTPSNPDVEKARDPNGAPQSTSVKGTSGQKGAIETAQAEASDQARRIRRLEQEIERLTERESRPAPERSSAPSNQSSLDRARIEARTLIERDVKKTRDLVDASQSTPVEGNSAQQGTRGPAQAEASDLDGRLRRLEKQIDLILERDRRRAPERSPAGSNQSTLDRTRIGARTPIDLDAEKSREINGASQSTPVEGNGAQQRTRGPAQPEASELDGRLRRLEKQIDLILERDRRQATERSPAGSK